VSVALNIAVKKEEESENFFFSQLIRPTRMKVSIKGLKVSLRLFY
jgi:hypothetical protein